MHTRLYRMIVLASCTTSLIMSSVACIDGGNGEVCYNASGEVIDCYAWADESVTDQTRQAIDNLNSTIIHDTGAWVSQHSAGEWSRDCMSVWSQTCETSGAYNK